MNRSVRRSLASGLALICVIGTVPAPSVTPTAVRVRPVGLTSVVQPLDVDMVDSASVSTPLLDPGVAAAAAAVPEAAGVFEDIVRNIEALVAWPFIVVAEALWSVPYIGFTLADLITTPVFLAEMLVNFVLFGDLPFQLGGVDDMTAAVDLPAASVAAIPGGLFELDVLPGDLGQHVGDALLSLIP